MGIGIIYNQDNATADEEVPGTCMFGSSLQTVDDQLKATLKRDKKNSELILRPQPSDDPADPLNWSPFRKEAAYFSLLLGAILVGVIGPLLVPDFGNILAEYKISLTQVIALNGWLVLTYGISSFLCVSLSDAMGRRPMYLASNLVISAGIVWGVNAKTYRSLLGARIVQGFGMGAYGCLVSSTITDVFFLHEQGTRVAIWQLAFNGSICITPIISGVLIQKLGRPAAFWILFVLAVLALVTSVLFLAETVYDRNDGVVTPVQMTDLDSDSKYVHDSKDSAIVSVEPAFKIEYRSNTIIPSQPMFTKSNLKPWKPLRYNTKEMITAMYRPALTLLSPNIMYATLLFTTTFTWFVQLSSLYSTIFGAPPYSFDSAKIGYISGISPFIGTMLALVTAGPLADRSARFLSKRNQGMFEAEMRLVLVLPCAICFAIGSFGMGYAVKHSMHYLVLAVFLGFLTAGAAFGTVCGIGYGASAFPARGGDTFGIIMLIKAVYAWGNTLFLAKWYTSFGPLGWFCVSGGITLGVCLLGVPMYCYGKQMRAWSVRGKTSWIFK